MFLLYFVLLEFPGLRLFSMTCLTILQKVFSIFPCNELSMFLPFKEMIGSHLQSVC